MPDKLVEWVVKFKHRGWITHSEIIHAEEGPTVNIKWSNAGKETVKDLLGLFGDLQTRARYFMTAEDFMWLRAFLELCTGQPRPTADADPEFQTSFKLQPAKYDTNERAYEVK